MNNYQIKCDVTGLWYIELGTDLIASGFESRADARQYLFMRYGVWR